MFFFLGFDLSQERLDAMLTLHLRIIYLSILLQRKWSGTPYFPFERCQTEQKFPQQGQRQQWRINVLVENGRYGTQILQLSKQKWISSLFFRL